MATDSSNRQGVRAVATTTTDPHRSEKRAVAARGAAGALALSILAVVLQSAATATPTWGYFTNPDAGSAAEKGYFGPWRQCKLLLYGRERCGQGVSRFQPVLAVWVAGLAAATASALLAILVGLAVLQLAMASSAKRVIISYSTALIGKVALATLATSLAIVAASLFALQTDDRASSFIVTRGEAFYMQLAAIALNFGVLITAVYEGIYARRGGDPTKIRVVGDPRAGTINNPGYREHQPTNGGTISMTDASGKPYVGGAGNGSMASVATSGSVTSTASPLRSSLKKPKPLGIHNPGFSAHSPTLSRNGSQKKVRIQTHSTEV
ncbi:uncharacterized protein LOC122720396 [Apis laboriosa]|uniref:Uncharacterized protein n=1 Tax=Apis cerana cerana TaxID=94128 RepID=A0A2A3ESF2_APICC|nr:uncharacterized protein LOC100867393 [Apis florea]XP_006622245.1 uncharacterized protein LOC102678044 [Apis dorsata]XP_016910663.1 uncharacterized protein LOC107996870 [Apis cerana]XP_043803032.1 uncharacterized protein LOC122720396 [Apis laboriosa]PBC34658.1 hypothetical protein APICC_05861 [Apis cerana cerana]